MKSSADELARRLAGEIGAGAVTTDPGALVSRGVDGVAPALLCSPAAAEQVGAVLRVCSDAGAAVVPWGGGTAMGIGNPPRHGEVAITLAGIDRLIEHDDANLTATVGAGMSLATLQEIAARRNQFLPFDPPMPGRATIGGTVAANLNGPRRGAYGSVRDLVIGMKVTLASGEQIKAGGKVVKNVAGYDMCKLFVGSLGTLGVITELTVRMAPLPETTETVMAGGALSQAGQLIDALSRSPLLPAAVALIDSGSADAGHRHWQVAVRCEGFAESVARHTNDTLALARRSGLTCEILRDRTQAELWERIGDFPLRAGRVVYRITVARNFLLQCFEAIRDGQGFDDESEYLGDALTGTLWVVEPAPAPPSLRFATYQSLARQRGGHAIILTAPTGAKGNIDVWGPSPPTLVLMGEIKRQFDPRGILNPGRFAGHL